MATLLGTALATDSGIIIDARASLRGRLFSAADYEPQWLQDGIDSLVHTLEGEGTSHVQSASQGDQPLSKARCVREETPADVEVTSDDTQDL